MAEQKQDDLIKHTYSSYVRIRDVALKTCQRRWTIGKSGERGSGISVLAARHDHDDDNWGMIFFILILFVNYILSFSLVRLRIIWLSARAGAHIEYSSSSRAEDVTITNVIIKTPDRKCDWGVNDVMPGSDGLGFLVILKKSCLLRSDSGQGELRFGPGRGQSSCGLRDARRVCWFSELILDSGRGSWLKDDVGTVRKVKNCVSLSSCRKTKIKKKVINVSYLN